MQSLDPVAVRTSADTTAVEQYADYRVAAWDIGSQPIRLDDVHRAVQRPRATRSARRHAVFVRSVLPADSAQRVPKPPRALFELSAFPWWLLGAHRRGDHRARSADLVVDAPPAKAAGRRRRRSVSSAPRRNSSASRRLRLLDAGERGRYVALMIEVLRDYLAARYAAASLSLTSTELQRAVRDAAARSAGSADARC